MKSVLITGAIGFIGSHLAENLLKNGFKITGIDNFSGAYDKKYYLDNLNLLNKHKYLTFNKINLLNKKAVCFILKKKRFDYIIHCAAKTNVRKSTKNPHQYLKNNVLGTQILLEAIKQYNPLSKIVMFSSSSVYGKQRGIPFRENMVPNPISPYGFSKYLMELVAKYYSDNYKLRIVILRPFSVYGPRGREDMLPSILLKSVKNDALFTQYGNDKNNQRDWTYINDVVKVITKIVNNYSFKSYEIFNIGQSHPIGIQSFVKKFCGVVGKKIKINQVSRLNIEIPIVSADITKAEKILKFKAKINLSSGLQNLLLQLNEKKN